MKSIITRRRRGPDTSPMATLFHTDTIPVPAFAQAKGGTFLFPGFRQPPGKKAGGTPSPFPIRLPVSAKALQPLCSVIRQEDKQPHHCRIFQKNRGRGRSKSKNTKEEIKNR